MKFRAIATIIIALGLLAIGTPALGKDDPAFGETTRRIQNLFNHEAKNWIQVGETLWSVQVIRDRKLQRDYVEPCYNLGDAPIVYNPVDDRRMPSTEAVSDAYLATLLDGLNLGWKACKVFQVTSDGVLVEMAGQQTMLLGNPAGYIDDKVYIFAWEKDSRRTYSYTTVLGAMRTVRAYKLADIPQVILVESEVRSVTGENLYDYFVRHRLTHFPNWVPDRHIEEFGTRTTEGGPMSGNRASSRTGAVYGYSWKLLKKRVPMRFSWEK